MYARVVTWQNGEADAIRANAAAIEERSAGGPPEGVPAKGLMFLMDPDNGGVLIVTLFETEEDMREGDATLNAMSPPNEGMGERAVSFYEVAVDRRL